MHCSECGTPATNDAAFCITCGAKLAALTPPAGADPSPAAYCAQCGAGLEENAKFCQRCGTRRAGARPAILRQRPAVRAAAIAGAAVAVLLVGLGVVLGLRAWQSQQELALRYEAATRAIAAGNDVDALQNLEWIDQRRPDYRDVAALLASARLQQAAHNRQEQCEQSYRQAQDDCSRQRWSAAISTLEGLRQDSPDYDNQGVGEMLFAAYVGAGRDLAAGGQFEAAGQQFDAALALHSDAEAEQEKELARLYPLGLATLQAGECLEAEEILRQVYGRDPGYQQVADNLYLARVCACQGLAADDRLDEAEAQCRAALCIEPQGEEAVDALQGVAFLRTPTPTPTPTATPTATATPSPTVAPTPKPGASSSGGKCRYAARGLIAFKRQARCDKKTGNACGAVEYWVMNADGTGQAKLCNARAYDWALLRDRTSNDGTWRMEVTGGCGSRADIVRRWLKTGQSEMIVKNNGKDWDPVLSADNWWLAWVTNRNGNDEIFVKTLDPKDQNQRRLTVNAWEWDKHPTWSPDGRKLAFYSNRADKLSEATRQIWVMEIANDRGVNLRNLSQKPDKVDSDPVWFKWDDMPR